MDRGLLLSTGIPVFQAVGLLIGVSFQFSPSLWVGEVDFPSYEKLCKDGCYP